MKAERKWRASSVTMLSVRAWLEVGQALTDKTIVGPRFFRADQTAQIEIGKHLSVYANGRKYGPGVYQLDRTVTDDPHNRRSVLMTQRTKPGLQKAEMLQTRGQKCC